MNTTRRPNAVLAAGAVTATPAVAGLVPGSASAGATASPPKPHGHSHVQIAAVLPSEAERDEISATVASAVM